MLAQRFNVDTDKARNMLTQLDARDVSLDASVHPELASPCSTRCATTASTQERGLMLARSTSAGT